MLVFPMSSGDAQTRFFAGALGGIATLSADGKSIVQPPTLSSSSYKPENGPTVDAFAGIYWNDYLGSQIDYLWNENSVALTSLQVQPAAFYLQDFAIRQNSALGSVLLYFRKRSSWVRPYLSAGTGIVWLSATPNGPATVNGIQPPSDFHSTGRLACCGGYRSPPPLECNQPAIVTSWEPNAGELPEFVWVCEKFLKSRGR